MERAFPDVLGGEYLTVISRRCAFKSVLILLFILVFGTIVIIYSILIELHVWYY